MITIQWTHMWGDYSELPETGSDLIIESLKVQEGSGSKGLDPPLLLLTMGETP